MPSKRQTPLEDPPSVSSSSEDSEEVTAEGGEDESEEEEEEEEVQPSSVKPSAQKPSSNSKSIPTPAPAAQPRSNSDSDEESDAESSSDSEPSPEKPKSSGPSRGADSTVKPIASKPMNDNAKTKKSLSSNSTAPAAAAASTPVKSTPVKPTSLSKRSLEVDNSEKESKQKKKKKKSVDAQEEDNHVEETVKKQGAEDSKKLFQRLWSDEDEIVILKGMLSYIKKGLNPSSNLSAFLDSIKSSLHIDVNKGQLNSKLARLKHRYLNQASRAKNGQDPSFSKPHDLKTYQLSKKIWGGKEGKEEGVEAKNGGSDSVATDGKKSRSGKTGNGVVLSQPKAPSVPESHHEVAETENEEQSLSLVQYGKTLAVPPPTLGDYVAKEGLGLIGSSKVKEFDERWRKILAAETKLYLQRLELAREYTTSILSGLEPSNS